MRGDNTTYLQNFRCSNVRFNDLVNRLHHSGLDVANERRDHQLRAGAVRLKKANEIIDPPSLRYKVACCMYALGQGGSTKVLADVASLGESTMRK